jgi:hypothetical protein
MTPSSSALELVAHVAITGIPGGKRLDEYPTHIDVHNAIREVARLAHVDGADMGTHEDEHRAEEEAILARHPDADRPPAIGEWLDEWHIEHTVWECRAMTPRRMWERS